MSKFSAFMKANKVVRPNGKYAPNSSLRDADGNPLEWEFRPITSRENDEIRDSCTRDVPVTGKPNVFRPKLDTSKYIVKLVCESTVFPDLYDAELQDSYGVKTPEELVYAMVDNAGEYGDFSVWMQNFQGFTKSLDETVEKAKN